MKSLKREKSTLHERNKHRSRYNFTELTASCPELSPFVALNKFGSESIDFANPIAVKTLNKALLKHFYQIDLWDIPDGYLCPPIPGRADYIHNVADLLASVHHKVIPTGNKVKVLDIGVGANCVYPIIGHQEYGWSFVGSEIDTLAVSAAKNIVEVNPVLRNAIEIRLQSLKFFIFKNIIHLDEKFDLTICNPPFHASAEEAMAGSQKKSRNLGHKNAEQPVLNFGGQHHELWTNGGELGFIKQMIGESKLYENQCFWFTTLVSKSENLAAISGMLTKVGAKDMRISEMSTGNKITRVVAWTFLDEKQQKQWQSSW